MIRTIVALVVAIGFATQGGARSQQVGCPDELPLWGGPLNAGTSEEACLSSRRAFVSISVDDRFEQVWWTTDGGRRWYRTRRAGPALFASGGRVYWAQGGAIYWVDRWPRGDDARRRCRNFSHRGACLAPTFVDAGARSAILVRLEDAKYSRDSFVVFPDRVIAPVLNTRVGRPARALILQGLRWRLVVLPEAGFEVCGGAVPTDRNAIYINGCRNGHAAGGWVSTDGGESWAVS